ncbi:beta-ketoacyl synthase N-terminal-like domain-containing protein [Sorangium sp. So ce375]|uniref:type I polyketide synthase n=1 Tax=Sorangium sp. So ce375 TaxID=3133306 RepID=UPI003F5CB911
MSQPDSAIAIVGMACRFPGADSPEQFWRNLCAGVESIRFFTDEELLAAGVARDKLGQPGFVAAKAVLDGADRFDAGFFGFSPRDAALMDPQQRVFLECAWAALEHAGYTPDTAERVGVFAGSILSMYLLMNLWPNQTLIAGAGNIQTGIGNDPTFLATSTSYRLNLRGPSISIGTACSTSLVAVQVACQSLLALECDMALAGGVSVHLPLISGYRFEEGGIFSPDGHCRPFDAAAAGTVSGDGAGVVVLKRIKDALADRDFIHAIIRGSAINNDGSVKVGYTAPSVAGQAMVIAEAVSMAEVDAASIDLVEAHGAGTPLGDPIEVAALIEAFGNETRGRCALGSVKSNVGHLDAAAGIAGLIKAAMAVRHRAIPPTLHFRSPNPKLGLERSPFYVNTQLEPCRRSGAMRAGVSSFGIGGTNVHIVLEEPPPVVREPSERPFDLLMLSARTPAALDQATERLADFLADADRADLPDIAATLRRGRRVFECRRVALCRRDGDAAAVLRDPSSWMDASSRPERPSVAFMFPGLGEHYAGMGWELYCTEPGFRASVDACAELLKGRIDIDLRDALYPGRDWRKPALGEVAMPSSAGKLDLKAIMARARGQTQASVDDLPLVAQPAIFVIEVALARLLESWGIRPGVMVGYSIGEFAAAHLAGVLSLADAVELVAARARLIQTEVPTGAMLAVPMAESELSPLLTEGLSLAAVNGDALCVVSGPEGLVTDLRARLNAAQVSTQPLRSTHAYHSTMMEAISEPLRAVLRQVTLRPPEIPYISCLTGAPITGDEATDPDYWARHLCRTVRLQAALDRLLEDGDRVLIEVGPGQSLSAHAIRQRAARSRDNRVVPTMRRAFDGQPELSALLRGIGELWLSGVEVDPTRFLAREGERRVPLPTYPFERERHWYDPPDAAALARVTGRRPDVADWFYLPAWKPSARPRRLGCSGSWLVLAEPSELVERLVAGLRRGGASVTLGSLEDELRGLVRGASPQCVVHLGLCTGPMPGEPSAERFERLQERGYFGLVRLLQAITAEGLALPERVFVVADHLFEVDGQDELVPEKATIRGPALVAPQEYPGLVCRVLDPGADDDAARAAWLLDELASEARDAAVAFRRGRRWVEAYEPVRLDASEPLRERGVYLITGGLGGVGLVLAKRLARQVQARLALLGRRSLPAREEWASWLAGRGEHDATSRRIRAVLELEALGAEVLVLEADVSDPRAMDGALRAVDARFGRLHGVFHCAGDVGAEAFREIAQADAAQAQAQFKSKVHGLLVLDRILAGRDLDFCNLVSSLSAVLGGLGFAAYAAANLFMNAYAARKRRASEVPWTSIDWDSWRLDDVRPVIHGLGASVNQFEMSPAEGAEACMRVLAQRDLARVVVSSGDLHERLRQWVGKAPEAPRTSTQLHARPDIGTPLVAPCGPLERELTEIWQELFGIAEVGVHDDFFALGGHSLLATQLNARLYARLHVEMSLSELLQAPTIAELARMIAHRRTEKAEPKLLEALLAEVEGLSPDEVERLLAQEII